MYVLLGLKHIFVVLRCLLINPNPESALNEEAGKLMLEDYDSYCKHAKIFTEVHALPVVEAENNAGVSGAGM